MTSNLCDLYVVFQGDDPNNLRFVEVEDTNGKSVRVGKWQDHPMHIGLCRLGPFRAVPEPSPLRGLGGMADEETWLLLHRDRCAVIKAGPPAHWAVGAVRDWCDRMEGVLLREEEARLKLREELTAPAASVEHKCPRCGYDGCDGEDGWHAEDCDLLAAVKTDPRLALHVLEHDAMCDSAGCPVICAGEAHDFVPEAIDTHTLVRQIAERLGVKE